MRTLTPGSRSVQTLPDPLSHLTNGSEWNFFSPKLKLSQKVVAVPEDNPQTSLSNCFPMSCCQKKIAGDFFFTLTDLTASQCARNSVFFHHQTLLTKLTELLYYWNCWLCVRHLTNLLLALLYDGVSSRFSELTCERLFLIWKHIRRITSNEHIYTK